MFKTLEELEKKYEEKIYTSVMAEHKRVVSKTVSETIFKPLDQLWDEIITRVFKDKKDVIFVGQKLSIDNQTAFIKEYESKKKIAIIFFTKDQFVIQTYIFKSLPNGFTKLSFTQSIKREKTVIGLNGQLGSIKYRWEVKKRAIEIFKSLQPKK